MVCEYDYSNIVCYCYVDIYYNNMVELGVIRITTIMCKVRQLTLCWKETLFGEKLIGILSRRDAAKWLNIQYDSLLFGWYSIQDIRDFIKYKERGFV